MKKPYSEARIGAVVLLGLVILIMTIVWGKGYTLVARSKIITVRFDDIAGLELGAFVLVNGMRKGKVLDFILEQEAVLVRCAVDPGVKLYDDARFEITSTELMGSKVVNINPGLSAKAPAPGFVFRGDSGGGMNQLMKMSANLVQNVQHLLNVLEATVSSINKTAGDPRLQEALVSSINNLDKSSQRTLDLITINESKLNQVMDNLAATTSSIRNMVESNSGDINSAISDIHEFVAQLSDISTGLKKIVEAAQSTEGTLGMLINDKQFAADLAKTLTGVDSLVQQIRAEGIQTNVSLFGKKKSSKPKNP